MREAPVLVVPIACDKDNKFDFTEQYVVHSLLSLHHVFIVSFYSSSDSYRGDSPHREDDDYIQTEGQNSDDDNHVHEEQHSEFIHPKLKYHSFMVKTPRERWSASQTQLFYEVI